MWGNRTCRSDRARGRVLLAQTATTTAQGGACADRVACPASRLRLRLGLGLVPGTGKLRLVGRGELAGLVGLTPRFVAWLRPWLLGWVGGPSPEVIEGAGEGGEALAQAGQAVGLLQGLLRARSGGRGGAPQLLDLLAEAPIERRT